MSSRTPAERICTAGRCTCGSKIVRGNDDTGQLATVDIYPVDAATELLAHMARRHSYVLGLATQGGLTLTRRTAADIVRKPVGYNRDRIVLDHHCPRRKATT